MADPCLPTTTATIPSMDTLIIAGYTGDRIYFHPGASYTQRMVGGFSKEPTVIPSLDLTRLSIPSPTSRRSPGTTLLWISKTTITFATADRRIRRAALRKIAFYRKGEKVTGSPFGTPGSLNNDGNTFDKALDGDPDSFFDAPVPTGAYVGMDTQ